MGGAAGSHVSVLPYTIHSVAVTEMRSVRRHTPPLGWHYVIIVLNSGAQRRGGRGGGGGGDGTGS